MTRQQLTALLAAAAILIGLLAPPAALAAKPRVAVLPFLIHAKEDLPELARELQNLLLPSLVSPTLEVLPTEEVVQLVGTPSLDPIWARQAGRSLKADWVIYGSMTKVGQQLSLDVLLLDIKSEKPPLTLYRQGRGMDSLKTMTASLGRELKSRVLGLREVVAVEIKGNRRTESEAITALMQTKAGEFFDPDIMDKDIRSIFGMGYFADVKARTEDLPGGKKVIVEVQENPAIRDIRVKGAVDDKDVIEAFNIPILSVYSGQAAANGLERVADMYRQKGYLNVEVSQELIDVKEGLGTILLRVNPKSKVYITDIRFTGNEKVSSSKLLKAMETKDWGIFSFLTSSGVLKREVLDKDVEKIKAYYHDIGYIKAQVGEPTVDIKEDGIIVTIPVEEGDLYKISEVNIGGELIKPEDELKKLIDLAPGDVYSRAKQQMGRDRLADVYASSGFAKVRVLAESKIDAKTKTVALNYTLNRGDKVYLERISIRGNVRTRDKVIRREMRLTEGQLFDASAIRRSAFNLRRLGYFDEVDFQTKAGSTPDKAVLEVRVKEKPTGMVNFGVGYSTAEQFMIMANISETNLFGRGQEVSALGVLGVKTTRGSLTFTEPYLFDRPLRWTTSVYALKREYRDYDKYGSGGYTQVTHPIWGEDVKATLRYLYEAAEITDIDDDASLRIQDQEGWHTTSSMTLTLRRDTRDQIFNTTKGSNTFVAVEYAGLGGTNYFTKYTAGTGWYFPLPYGTTFFANGRWGYVEENPGGDLPLYEKFYLGGINSLRGFKLYSVSPRDPATGDRIGGEKMLQFNFEFIFPVMPSAGVKGLVFFDAGNSWAKADDYDLGDMRQSVGAGVRWYSPVGPIRLEYGWVIDGEEGDGEGGWEFSIGTFF